MAVSFDDLDEVMNKVGNDMLHEQAAIANPLEGELEVKSVSGDVVINIVSPGQSGGGFIADGGARQVGNTRTPVQGHVKPKRFHHTIEFNNGLMGDFGGGFDYVEQEVKAAGASIGQTKGTAMYGTAGLICNIVSATKAGTTVANVVLTCVLPSEAGLLEGMSYEIKDGYDDRVYLARLKSIVPSTTGFGCTVQFDQVGLGASRVLPDPVDTTSAIYIRGSHSNADADATGAASGLGVNSLDDITSSSGTLHDITVAARPDWTGIQFDVNGVAGTQEMVISRLSRVRSIAKKMPDLMAVSPGLHTALAASATTVASSAFGLSNVGGHIRKNADVSLNKYGKEIFDQNKLMIGATRMMLDDNIASDNIIGADGYTSAYLINTEHLKVYEWQKIAPQTQSGSKFILDQSNDKTLMFWAGSFNVGTNFRRAHAKIFDIAVSL